MEDKNDTKVAEKQAFFVRLFGLIIVLLGCLSFALLFFYYPLLQSLGFLTVIVTSAIVSVLGLCIAHSGFAYAEKLSKNVATASWFEPAAIYLISFFAFIFSVVSFMRIAAWACSHFLAINIKWFELPNQ